MNGKNTRLDELYAPFRKFSSRRRINVFRIGVNSHLALTRSGACRSRGPLLCNPNAIADPPLVQDVIGVSRSDAQLASDVLHGCA